MLEEDFKYGSFKKHLTQNANRQAYRILKEDNRYVSRAVEYAFEILQQERGILLFWWRNIENTKFTTEEDNSRTLRSYIKKREQE